MKENEIKFMVAVAQKTVEDIKHKPTKKIKVEILKEHYEFFQAAAEGLEMSLDDYLTYFIYAKAEEAGMKINIQKERRLARNN